MKRLENGSLFDQHFRIDSHLGTGGMAQVYKATDLNDRKTVALKILKEEYANDPEFLRRFRSEAQTVLQLSHHGIVKSFDVGEVNGIPYIVLDFIEGCSLKEYIKEHAPIYNRKAIEITVQLCDALAYAHKKHLVHRDVKPQNIIMQPDGTPRVTDFGIARFVDASTQTYAGSNVLGSVHYISPEQARGETVNHQSDIYSLGIVLYEMVTGEVPFQSENTVSIAVKHISEPMIPAMERNPKVGTALNDIIQKATAKSLTERYQSMEDFRKDLMIALKSPSKHINSGNQGRPRIRLSTIIATSLVLIIGLTVLFVFGSKFFRKETETFFVPNLLKKMEQQGEEDAKRMGFVFSVRSYVDVADALPGEIVMQEPKPGSTAVKGSKIYVNVQGGEQSIFVPDFANQMLDYAESELGKIGIKPVVIYEISDLPEGTIIEQWPEPNEEIQRDDIIQLWVSGSENNLIPMPSVTSKQKDTALQLIANAGFSRIYIYYVDDPNVEANMVIDQEPAADTQMFSTSLIELRIKKASHYIYGADVAFNVDVPKNDSRVRVIVQDGTAFVVLFDQIMSEGDKKPIVFTMKSETSGDRLAVILIEDEVVRTEVIKLAKR